MSPFVLKRLSVIICLACCLLFLGVGATEASTFSTGDYPTLTSRHFLITYPKRLEPLAREYAPRWDREAEQMAGDLGLTRAPSFALRLAGNEREFRRLLPGPELPPSWASAVAYPRLRLMVVKTPAWAQTGITEWEKTFRHELTHLLLGAATGGKIIPRWLEEGLAQYEARQGSLAMASVMARGVLGGEVFTLSEITYDFPPDPESARLAYTQSFYFIAYLRSRFGPEALKVLLRDLAQGVYWTSALRRVTGLDLPALENDWRRHLKWRFNWLPLLSSSGVFWFLLSAAFIAVYLKKKAQTRKTLAQWEIEEAMQEKLNNQTPLM